MPEIIAYLKLGLRPGFERLGALLTPHIKRTGGHAIVTLGSTRSHGHPERSALPSLLPARLKMFMASGYPAWQAGVSQRPGQAARHFFPDNSFEAEKTFGLAGAQELVHAP